MIVHIGEKVSVNRSVRFSNSISCEALKHESEHADRETKYYRDISIPLIEFPDHGYFSIDYGP